MSQAMSTVHDEPSVDEAIARAKRLSAKLTERSVESEKFRRVPDATVAEFIDAGLNQLIQPRSHGGWGMGWDTHIAIALALGKGDASQGWVLTGFAENNHLVCAFAREAQDEVWQRPNALVAMSHVPAGKLEAKGGGFIASGKWSATAGIDHAEWLLASATVHNGEEARRVNFLVPKSAATVIDDWNTSGLAGAGAKSFTLDGVQVPAHRVSDSQAPGVGASLALASVALGTASTMIEEFSALCLDGRTRGLRVMFNFATGLRIAESKAEVDAASLYALNAARESTAAVLRGETPSPERRALNTLAAGYAAIIATRAADRIFGAAGSKAIYLTNRLHRHLVDIRAIGMPDALAWEATASVYGLLAVGGMPQMKGPPGAGGPPPGAGAPQRKGP